MKEVAKYLLEKYEITPDPKLDQFFLIDETVLEELVDLGNVGREDTVLEVGAGLGFLTEKLAEKARMVYTVEIDERYLPVLEEGLSAYDNVDIKIENALKIRFPEFDKIISSIPFSIAEPLFYKLAYYDFERGVLVLPGKFIDRITAKRGDRRYSQLSLFASSSYHIDVRDPIDSSAYYPSPGVYSAMVRISPWLREEYEENPLAFLVSELFRRRNWKVKNALREGLISLQREVYRSKLTKREARKIIEAFSIDKKLLNKRVTTSSTEELESIVDKIRRSETIDSYDETWRGLKARETKIC